MLTPTQIFLKLGRPSVSPVKFNNIDYTPVQAYILSPSQTAYSGVKSAAEFYIFHIADTTKPLLVRIPIGTASTTTPSTLDDIITQTATLLPKTGYTNLNIPSFSLEQYVPSGPFYYSDTGRYHEIYYGLDKALFISDKTMKTLKQIVGEAKNYANFTGELFYNPDGSNITDGGADFNFLECEQYYEEDIPADGNNSPNLFRTLMISPKAVTIFWYSVYTIIAGILLYVFYKFLYNI
jgi:hypothetical protein